MIKVSPGWYIVNWHEITDNKADLKNKGLERALIHKPCLNKKYKGFIWGFPINIKYAYCTTCRKTPTNKTIAKAHFIMGIT